LDSSKEFSQPLNDGELTIDLRSPDDYIIPTNHTTYESFCFSSDDLETMGLDLTSKTQLVKVHYLEGGNEACVHHVAMYGELIAVYPVEHQGLFLV
jgi:hypothetical protein